jgi:hypothetical protein
MTGPPEELVAWTSLAGCAALTFAVTLIRQCRRPRHAPAEHHPGQPSSSPPAVGRAAIPAPASIAAFAAAFAADYLSWDETDPYRRGAALVGYVRALSVGDATSHGWSRSGRQRVDVVVPGAVHVVDDARRIIVDVRLRYTPFARGEPSDRNGGSGADAVRPHPGCASAGQIPASSPGAGIPAAAPSAADPDWHALSSRWARLAVPVVLDDGLFLIDIGNVRTYLGESPPPARSS